MGHSLAGFLRRAARSFEGLLFSARTSTVTTCDDILPRLLTTFVTVAEEHSFTRTAQRLHLTQPGVSRHISALEKHLGVPLMIRTTHQVVLTPAGAALLPEARRVLAAVRRLVGVAYTHADGQVPAQRSAPPPLVVTSAVRGDGES
jgi:DNA-binding transcriptional LysR family regulator